MYKNNKNISNKKYRIVDGIRIPVYSKDFSSYYNSVSVEAGTTGYMGGSTKFGGRTFFKILGDGMNMSIQKDEGGKGFTVKAGGDVELDLLINSLEYILNILKQRRDDSEDRMRNDSYKSVYNKDYDEKKEKNHEAHVINKNAMATDKQIEYIKVLAIRHRYELNTRNIKRKDADELINILKEQGDIKIPGKFIEYFNYKPEKWNGL